MQLLKAFFSNIWYNPSYLGGEMSFIVDYIHRFFAPAIDLDAIEEESHRLTRPESVTDDMINTSGICMGTCTHILSDLEWDTKEHRPDRKKRWLQNLHSIHFDIHKKKVTVFGEDGELIPAKVQEKLGIKIYPFTQHEEAYDFLGSMEDFEGTLKKVSSVGRYLFEFQFVKGKPGAHVIALDFRRLAVVDPNQINDDGTFRIHHFTSPDDMIYWIGGHVNAYLKEPGEAIFRVFPLELV